jgi:tetratricopeptide (TPR) repeat protein
MARIHRTRKRRAVAILAAAGGALIFALAVQAEKLSWLEQIPLEAYEEMREVERYQLGIAEKHYLKGEYKIALDEYDKYLTLYEASAGAPYAQLMWSHCQVRLRKVNTAIREGFQSVIDYWPESAEAVRASYLIGKSYQDMGQVEQAGVAYRRLVEAYADTQIAVLAKVNLLEMAKVAQDDVTRRQLLENLVFDTERTEAAREYCESASRELAGLAFHGSDWDRGVEVLETRSPGGALAGQIYEHGRRAMDHMRRDEETRKEAEAMGKKLIVLLEGGIPVDLEGDANRKRAWVQLTRIAGIHETLGRANETLATYERMEKMLGTSDSLLGVIASYHRRHGDGAKAMELYRRYENVVAGLREIAKMLRETGKNEEAIEVYQELIDLDPDRVDEYQWAMGECYEATGSLKKAIEIYRLVDRWPENYFRMASCHRRLKEYDEALVLYNQCKAHEGSNPEAMIQIGYTFEQAGKKESAIKAMQLVCRTHPKSRQASRAHSHLQSKYKINVTLGGAKDD